MRETRGETSNKSARHIGRCRHGVGTGGTITGAGRFLKRNVSWIQILLADPVGSRLGNLVSATYPATMLLPGEGIGGSVAPANSIQVCRSPSNVSLTRRVSRVSSFAAGSGDARRTETPAHHGPWSPKTAPKTGQPRPVVAVLADSWGQVLHEGVDDTKP